MCCLFRRLGDAIEPEFLDFDSALNSLWDNLRLDLLRALHKRVEVVYLFSDAQRFSRGAASTGAGKRRRHMWLILLKE
jgi:hypothetical protein